MSLGAGLAPLMHNPRLGKPLPRSTSAALAAWVAVPGAVLLALASGLRLSHTWPDPVAAWAMPAVLWSQVLLAALTFPRLMSSRWSLLATIALAAPLLAGAAALSARPGASSFVAGWLWLALWLIVLALLSHLTRRTGTAPTAVAAAGLGAAALPVVAYMSAETGEAGVPEWLLGPLRGADASTLLHRGFVVSLMAPAGAITGLLAIIFFRRAHRRKASSPPDNNFSTS